MAQDDQDMTQVSKSKDWLHIDPMLATPVQAVLLNNLQVMRNEITDIKGQIAELKLMAQKSLLGDRQVPTLASISLDSGESAFTSRAPNEQQSDVKVDDLINRHEDMLLRVLSAHKAGRINLMQMLRGNIDFEATESMKYFNRLAQKLQAKEMSFSGQDRAEARAAELKDYGTLTEFRQLSDGQRATLFTSICDRAAKKEAAAKRTEGDAAKTTGDKTRSVAKEKQAPSQAGQGNGNNNSSAREPSSTQQNKGTSVGTKRKNVPD